MLKKS
jgi:hypothetical protein